MMKLGATFLVLISAVAGFAQTRAAPKKRAAPAAQRSAAIPAGSRAANVAPMDQELNYALGLAKQGDYANASIRLFNMTRNPKYIAERMRIKYILGLMFYEMKMYQVSAFQFVDVIRNADTRYIKQSLRKLSLAADILNDDTLINYAIGKVNVEDFPKDNQDMLRYRIGEYQSRKQNWDAAVDSFGKVPDTSPYYPRAKYMEGLADVKRNDLNGALKSYYALSEFRANAGITDIDRVSAIMGMARVYYQAHKWDLAINMYRQIPRDTEMWHDALFEMSWAYMRAARFRSVLSNLHSLHSPFYEDFYLPESILLRGIVYLYICQYDEMEKTLALFDRIYSPVQTKLEDFTTTVQDPVVYFNETERTVREYNRLRSDTRARNNLRIPFLVGREIIREGDFKHIYTYISKLRQEDAVVDAMPVLWRRSPVGVYAKQLLKGRLDTSIKIAGNIVRAHMMMMKQDLADMFEQYNFAKYEMLNGKKEALKRKIQGKGIVTAQVDDSKNRSFYIQNGFEYWPFRGEYWLDEIGDYKYLGTQGCE
jgi:tetratricopeptide (TPR) repeat protein